MYRSIVKILHYPKLDDETWSETSTEILNTIDLQTDVNIDIKSDTFQMQVFGETTINFSSYDLDDRFEVFAKNVADGEDITDIDTEDTTIFDSTFIYSGVLNNWKYTNADDGSRQFIIQGANVSERLLKTMLPAGYITGGSFNYTAPDIIKNLIELTNEYSSGKDIMWHPDNPTVMSNGQPFPEISYSSDYKPVYQMIADISKEDKTGDGVYYYYIKGDHTGNYLVWRKRNSTIPPETTLTENIDFVKPTIEYGIWDTVNFLIINGGKDPRGNGILTFYIDSASAGQIGVRGKYFPMDIAEALHKYEQVNSPGDFADDTRFPSGASYPYSTKFVNPYLNIVSESISNEAEYVSWFRKTVKTLSKYNGKAYVDKYKYARFKMSCEAAIGVNNLVVGQVYNIVCPSIGWTNVAGVDNTKNLRLVDIKYHVGIKGWTTDYEFEQDWDAVISGGQN